MIQDSELGGKGGAETPRDLHHIREKVGLLLTSPIGQLSHLPIGGPFPPDPGTSINGSQINTDLVNHFVPLTTEPSTSLVRVGTDVYKSIINSILRYKDYDSHTNAHKDFQKRFVDIHSIDTGVQIMIGSGLKMI
ncbi:uncharacterized protein TNCV_1842061 [Trichonephila clavipes]|nr:uncharacterized protein TNCV_1842061 [Trichonephila clavipes]